MKNNIILLLGVIVLSACSSIKVTTDYDNQVDFSKFKTFAFYKPEIDKSDISDLDKRRILRALESELVAQGFTKSDSPSMLVSFFTKSRERVDVNQNNIGWGWGWGWNPWMMNGGMNNVNVSQFTEGTLFVDFIDKEKKELIWQGIGTGALRNENRDKKEIRIKEFVKEIVSRFPPEKKN
ncbi:MAG: DUF4136 domain-containing protein [Flavobacteriia bacterium]|nr:DUF4136 domain-containing protein [Flavobacteriia bacterium]OIP48605.1 MAG: hypothetical protein AUK46_01010 [Flavobacteriaceae bacterium CG2_30_31_66]PIV95374.1 MAG: DUF4136 domain-containing protein [Flavobacteriaceae bacterium CG17_big_fil_post_rev_8_21_14_2_50_31_13]PIX11576.1 MAG: DUF4136 domain-containing protein [Flavobacteriaceae bacterium CG_4_8_14_3_um_filter_31_8]PIY14257.1 MAG: DUF4136 domain-containing protein [Flavobacteriaceae bacterium CG_4_10_14_3_um_filter_31_253]PIZ09219.